MCNMSSTDDKTINRDQNESENSESDHSSEAESELSEEEHICIRAKWTIDGSATIDEAIDKLNNFMEYLKELKNEGWTLREPINDDYGFLYKTETN